VTPLGRTLFSLTLLAALSAGGDFARSLPAEAQTLPSGAKTSNPAAAGPEFSPEAPLAPDFYAAAHAARQGGFAAARKVLAPRLGRPEPDAAKARVVLGLLAAEYGQPAEAQALLAKGPGPVALEDLRLSVLADLAAAGGAQAQAKSARIELLRATPGSPLRAETLLRLAEAASQAQVTREALGYIEQGRRERLSARERELFDTLAWTIGRATRDDAVEREAARRLLVSSPLAAARLDVAGALVTRPGGDWRVFLGVGDLLARAGALLSVDVPQGALVTLDAVAPEARELQWSLLRARALTAAERGSEALTVLAAATGKTADEVAELELERAHAASDASAVRRGRPPLPGPERAKLRTAQLGALRNAATIAASPALKATALRELYVELSAAGEVDATLALLHELARVAPDETLGARPLWERGWREYEGGNWSGAIGYWSELRDLYPAISYARSAQYWSARAFEKLGDRERSAAAYVELTRADTADFYSRQAALRIPGRPPVARRSGDEREAGREAWPTDPRIERARWLSDLGLDKLATAELDRTAALADGRAVGALRGLVLARSGARRESLRELRKAFPRLATAHQETVPRAALELFYPRPYSDDVLRLAKGQALPSSLVFGIIHQESGFDPEATSRSGARGLMQLMPATGKDVARRLGMAYSTQRLYEPEYSLRLGTTYFRQMLGIFDNRVELALAGYNGGPGRISRLWREQQSAGEVDRFLEGLALTESRNYVKRILVLAESYRSLYSDLS
jgi:soluble lytic murein transglycosylase-like protein